MFDLEIRDKIAVITGGSDGLGRATAKLMALNGVKVVISGRRLEYLNDVAEKLSAETGGTVKAVQSDVCVAEDCNRLVSETVNHFGGIDISPVILILGLIFLQMVLSNLHRALITG